MGKLKEFYNQLKQAVDELSGSNKNANEDLKQQENESFEQWAVRLNKEKTECEAKIEAYAQAEKTNLMTVGSTVETMQLDVAFYQYKLAGAQERKVLIENILSELDKQKVAEQSQPNE